MAEYIEREAAIKPLRRWQKIIVKNYGKNDEYAKCLEDAIDKLIDIPTADVQPVRHGRWMKTIGENGVTSAYRCNLCGFEDNRYSLFNYCPNCGAKMDVGET